jgi:osmoprotectant transport system ATP-binding protein
MQRQLDKTVIMVSHDIDEAIKLGDKVAIFRAGKLVQFDNPDTLLARPKDDFVGAFVGQDHTLKRLLLVRAGEAATTPVTARPDVSCAQALALMDEDDARYLTITDADNRALGYLTRRDVRGSAGEAGSKVRPFTMNAGPDENLRVVLSKMYKQGTSWMPVIDAEGAYVGEVTQDSIATYLSSGRSRGMALAA